MQKIIDYRNVRKGTIVLRREESGMEWVTGFIPIFEDKIPIADSTEHLWGHYFKTEEEARTDFNARVERGY